MKNAAKNQKLLGLMALATLGIATSQAHARNATFEGFFGGMNLGTTHNSGHLEGNSQVTFEDVNGTTQTMGLSNSKTRVAQSQGAGGFTLGYSSLFHNCFYLAGEVGGSYAPGTLSGRFNSTHTDVPGAFTTNTRLQVVAQAEKQPFEIAADLMPGMLVRESLLLFGRIGVSMNRIDLETTTTFNYSDNAGTHPFTLQLPLSSRKTKVALRLGVGLGHHISENLLLTANYIYSYYGKLKVSGVMDVPAFAGGAVPGGFTSSTTAKFQRQAVFINFNYFFQAGQ